MDLRRSCLVRITPSPQELPLIIHIHGRCSWKVWTISTLHTGARKWDSNYMNQFQIRIGVSTLEEWFAILVILSNLSSRGWGQSWDQRIRGPRDWLGWIRNHHQALLCSWISREAPNLLSSSATPSIWRHGGGEGKDEVGTWDQILVLRGADLERALWRLLWSYDHAAGESKGWRKGHKSHERWHGWKHRRAHDPDSVDDETWSAFQPRDWEAGDQEIGAGTGRDPKDDRGAKEGNSWERGRVGKAEEDLRKHVKT